MGVNMSFMGGQGLSRSQTWSLIISTLYKQFDERDIKDFDAFNVAILNIFNTINMALLNKHYDAPSQKDVMGLFKQWKEAKEEAKKKILTDFMNKNVNINKVDKSMIATAIVAPPAAMLAKRTGQTLPWLKLMNSIPDVVFVPSATILSLITVKILGIISIGNNAPNYTKEYLSDMDHEMQQSNSNNIPTSPPAQHREPASFVFWWTPEPASSQQPEPEKPPQQPEEEEPALAPAAAAPAPDHATLQQSEPEAAAAASQKPEPALSQEHTDKENPSFCAICNRVH